MFKSKVVNWPRQLAVLCFLDSTAGRAAADRFGPARARPAFRRPSERRGGSFRAGLPHRRFARRKGTPAAPECARPAARNATLRHLKSEAYRLQVRQVVGPGWLDQNEYDLEARTGGQTDRAQMDLMLRTLLSERFNLRQHREMREMRKYELLADKGGIKIPQMKSGAPPSGTSFPQGYASVRGLSSSPVLYPDVIRPKPTRQGWRPGDSRAGQDRPVGHFRFRRRRQA